MTREVFLQKNKSLQSTNKTNSVSVSLDRNAKLLPRTDFINNISLLDVYDNERQTSNKLRLTFSIYPYCTNALFNNVTEVIKYNADGNIEALKKETPTSNINGIVGKPKNFEWNLYQATRDTQISNDICGWEYYCGLNIFNNHLLRKNTFKAVCPIKGGKTDDNFNTIEDYMRQYNGEQVMGYSDINYTEKPELKLHLYLKEDVDTFKSAVSKRLIEENGWFGFKNSPNITTYELDDETEMNIMRPINNRKSCEMVYMYPTPDLYSFNPKYNKYKNRYEQNWNYCLTYPSSSTTQNFDYIFEHLDDNDESNVALKVMYFVDNNDSTTVYSKTKHGLKEGDLVNIYKNKNLYIKSALVTKLGDIDDKDKEYIFTISNNGTKFSNKYAELSKEDLKKGEVVIDGKSYVISTNRATIVGDDTFYVVGNRINVDSNSKNISFKKVDNGCEVDYYVRIFSRIPNWKFVNGLVNEYNIYENKPTDKNNMYYNFLLNHQYRFDKDGNNNDFSSVLSNLAYAKTIYNDDVSQIVFTDDIEISYLKDNLGRPLHEIFISFFKNNRGYKLWYGETPTYIDNKNLLVEYSHAFGKLTSAFKLSKFALADTDENISALSINNIDGKGGIDLTPLRENVDFGSDRHDKSIDEVDDNEVDFYNDIHFYGDLCSYSSYSAVEESIQQVCHRFNSAQRELKQNKNNYEDFSKIEYDEIEYDDYDYGENTSEPFKMKDKSFTTFGEVTPCCQRKEGYYYKPHYRIQVHSISKELYSIYPKMFRVKEIVGTNNNVYKIITKENNFIECGDKIVYFNSTSGEYYKGVVLDSKNNGVINNKTFQCKFEKKLEMGNNLKNDRILKLDVTVPSYATPMKDGSCRYSWREIIPNGYDTESDIEEYPFTNGAFYINNKIDFYVHRQDPHKEMKKYTSDGSDLGSNEYPHDPNGNFRGEETENNYYKTDDITC